MPIRMKIHRNNMTKLPTTKASSPAKNILTNFITCPFKWDKTALLV